MIFPLLTDFSPKPLPTSLTYASHSNHASISDSNERLSDFNFEQGLYLVVEADGVYERYRDRSGGQPTLAKRRLQRARFFLASDSFIEVENKTTRNIAFKRSSGEVSETVVVPKGKRTRVLGQKMLFEVFLTEDVTSGPSVTKFNVVISEDISIVTQIGTAALFTFGKVAKYSLEPGPVENGPSVIRKTPFPQISQGLTGQVYVFFNDDFGLKYEPALRWLTLGSYDPSYHRFGIVAGLTVESGSDAMYQLGLAWALDRKAQLVISYGVLFRNRERLIGLNPGDSFSGASLPVTKTFIGVPFFGISLNFGS